MKNAFLAVIIALILVYAFGNLFNDWWGIHLMMGDDMLSPLENFAAASAVGLVFVAIGFIVALSVFGTLALAVFACVAALLVMGLSALWPVLLVAAVIWLFRRPRQSRTVYPNH
ncbi:hypothetical protein Q4520_16355 [Alteromonas sp. 1_MG-2023]|uniref:hypothetical protein n=1 Tax=Alteromonas sp. 1_MG-2023 TaxID=3062669 RepID=UPI0026E2CF49|nr:hypothetical protein [Alteromonas sp. 1_MG-2023]MDO6476998.1 hypothetical protein [Alteromonas sp. 1_MG-2023]